MIKSIYICTLFICIGFFVGNANADHITLASDDWCPINCTPETEKPGYMVELARHIFEKAGHTVEYKMVPWERAIAESRKNKYSAIIGAYIGDAPDFVFPKNEQALIGNSFFASKESTWTYKDLSSLSKVKIGVIKGYDYGEEMNLYIKENNKTAKVQVVAGETALELNIKKLLKGRIDAILESEFVFNYKVSQMGFKEKIKSAGQAVEPEKTYIAFSPANPKSKEYAKILSDGMEQIRKSGELKKILNRYGLDDWK